MNEVVEKLKSKAAASRLDLAPGADAFALMAAECSACCKVSNSGNGSCPPPKVELEQSL
jgi:hypothetical protein